MSNFQSTYFDDYVFEPDLRKRSPYHERAKENVERAYDAQRRGLPLFISSACLIRSNHPPNQPWNIRWNYESRTQYEPELTRLRTQGWYDAREPANHWTPRQSSGGIYERPETVDVDVDSGTAENDREDSIARAPAHGHAGGSAADDDVSNASATGQELAHESHKPNQRKRRRRASEQDIFKHPKSLAHSRLSPSATRHQEFPTRVAVEHNERNVNNRRRHGQMPIPADPDQSTPHGPHSAAAAYSIEGILTAKRMSAHAQLVALETLSDGAEDVGENIAKDSLQSAAPSETGKHARKSRRGKRWQKMARNVETAQPEKTDFLDHTPRVRSNEREIDVQGTEVEDEAIPVSRAQILGATQAGLPTPDDSGEDGGLPTVQVVDDTFLSGPDEIEGSSEEHLRHNRSDSTAQEHDLIPTRAIIKQPDNMITKGKAQINTGPKAAQPEQYATLGFTAVNSSACSVEEAVVPRAPSAETTTSSEQNIVIPKPAKSTKAVKSSKSGSTTRTAASKAERSCHECQTTESDSWRKGPDGPATLCAKCGKRYYNKTRREVQAAAKAQSKTVLELAANSSFERRAVLSPRKPNPRINKTVVKPISRPQFPSKTPARPVKGKARKAVPSSARKSLGFGQSPHEDVLRKVFRNALTDASRLNGKLDELVGEVGYQNLLDNRLGPFGAIQTRTPQTSHANDRTVTAANSVKSVGKNKNKRMMTFDTPPVPQKTKRIRTEKPVSDKINDQSQELAQHDHYVADMSVHISPSDKDMEMQETAVAMVEVVTIAQDAESAKFAIPPIPLVVRTPQVDNRKRSARISTGKLSSRKRPEAMPNFLSSSAPLRQSSQDQTDVADTPKEAVIQSTQALLMEAHQAFADECNSSFPPPADTTNTPPISAAKISASSRKAVATPYIRRGVATTPMTAQSAPSPQSFLAEEEEDEGVPADTQAMLNGFEWQHSDSPPQSYVSYVSPTITKAASVRRTAFRSSPVHDPYNEMDIPASSAASTTRKKGALKSKTKRKSTSTPLSQGAFNFSRIMDQPSQRAGSQDSQSLFDIEAFLDHTGVLDTSVHMSQR